MLRFRTNDDYIVRTEADDLKISNLVQVLMESTGQDDEDEEIPLYNVSYKILIKILEFTRHYNKDPMQNIPKPLPNDHLPVQEWYVGYISMLQDETLYELLHASTYMDIEPLQQLVCARIASLIKGKECHELKKIFGIGYEP